MTCKSALCQWRLKANMITHRDDSTYLYFQDRSRGTAPCDTDEPAIEKHDHGIDITSSVRYNTTDFVTFEEDRKNERLMHGIKLLLVARDRVLSLSEHRVCGSLPVSSCF